VQQITTHVLAKVEGQSEVQLPIGARVLGVIAPHSKPALVVQSRTDEGPSETRRFVVVADWIPFAPHARYVGTLVNGAQASHVLELEPPEAAS
jgi:hypothetical protein